MIQDLVTTLSRIESHHECMIIAIDGRAGAGKSTLAAALAYAWDAAIIQTDDFASWQCPLDWWPRLIDEALIPLKTGRTARYRKIDFDRGVLTDTVREVSGPRIILEGVSSSRKEFRTYLNFAIWVETPEDICLQRGVQRDGQAVLPRWLKWVEAEHEYIDEHRPKDYCNLVIDGLK